MAKNNEKYAYLNRLSTEQLEELLRMDMEEAKPGNEDVVFHILEVIEQRENDCPTGSIPDVDEAWVEFQKYYDVPEGDGTSLYPCGPEPNGSTNNTTERPSPRKPRLHRCFKQALVAVVAVAAVFGGMVVAQASGIDVFGTLGRWTEDIFRFEPSNDVGGGTDSSIGDGFQEYSIICDALASIGIDESLAPTWLPTDLKVGQPEIKNSSVSKSVNLTAHGENDTFLSIDIIQYASPQYLSTTQFEKDAENMEQYLSNQKTFYIFSNIDTITATWSDGLLVEQITGNVSIEEIKAIIDSIGVV